MSSDPADEPLLEVLAQVVEGCRGMGRPELAEQLAVAATRLRRPATVVCVVGEYKQGKSRLVDALVGQEVCPVDDDLATATVTVVGHGDAPRVVVHRREDGETIVEEVPPDDAARYIVEPEDGVPLADLVEIAVSSQFLARGVVVVDTPGVNAFRRGDDRAVLDFLRYADGLVLVTDAAMELSPLELRFLAEARTVCPTVVVALTKIDLHPEWRRIEALDRSHLADLDLSEALVPVSAALRTGSDADAATVGIESGFDVFLTALDHRIVGPVRELARSRALDELSLVTGELRSVEHARLAAAEDPAAAESILGELRRNRDAIGRLRAAGSGWHVVLNDGFADVRSELDYRLRTAIRDRNQAVDRLLSDADPDDVWEEVLEDLKAFLTDLATESFDSIRTSTVMIEQRLVEVLAVELPEEPLGVTGEVDLAAIWSSQRADRSRGEGTGSLWNGLSVLRGGYSGMLMLGMLAQVVGIPVLGPVSIGAGVLFGMKQHRDERQRQVERRRQQARVVVRQLLDQAQFELSTRCNRAVQDSHRALRDHYAGRIRDLSAMYASTVRSLEQARDADQDRRAELVASARRRLEEIDQLVAAVDAVRAGIAP